MYTYTKKQNFKRTVYSKNSSIQNITTIQGIIFVSK